TTRCCRVLGFPRRHVFLASRRLGSRCAEESSMLLNGSRPPRHRIAHVALQLQTGGMEKLLVEFARHADREQFELHFVSIGGRGTLADDIESAGWTVTALNTPPGLRPW